MIPDDLKKLREQLDWSQQEAADRLGVTLRTYGYYEQGVTSSGTKLKQVPKSVAATMLAYGFVRRLELLHVPPAAEPKPARARTRRQLGGFDPTDVIRVIREYPFKPGRQNAARWLAACKDGRTVAESIRLGFTVGDIKWYVARGYLKLEPAPSTFVAPIQAGTRFPANAIITLLVDKNPKKPGNKNHPWFAAIMSACKEGKCTVAEAIAAGAPMGEIKYDVAHNFIKVEPADASVKERFHDEQRYPMPGEAL